jgi:hypothetical protein
MTISMAVGQACGTAAAMAAAERSIDAPGAALLNVRNIDIAELRRRLIEGGARLM